MPAEWQDTTGYKRGERGTVPPREWTLDVAGLRVVIHHLYGIENIWFGTCHQMNVMQRQLKHVKPEFAQVEFVSYLEQIAGMWHDALRGARK